MNVAGALAGAALAGLARLDAQLLLLHVLDRSGEGRAWLLAHDGDVLTAPQAAAFEALVRRRSAGEPVAYLLGEKEFFGLRLRVDPRVLVPRPDTETLVDWSLEVLRDVPGPTVIDLGTGSGAIALALRHARPDADVEAVDASEAALRAAAANGERLGLSVRWRQADWLAGAGRYDLIVSNPPYIAQEDPHLPDLRFEPASALVSGSDGLDAIRRIVADAPAHLRPGGWLLLEHGHDQAAAVRALLEGTGFTTVQSRRDLAGIERCSGGQRLELG